jgi:hypothetical protein
MLEFSRGDVRTAASGSDLFERIVASGSLVLRKLGGTRAGEMSAHRFLSSPHVTVASILDTFSARAQAASTGRVVVVAQDTTEINFSGRERSRRGLGLGGDGRSAGFFIHPNVVVDASEGQVLGLAGAQIWTRGQDKAAPRGARKVEEKESGRWLKGSEMAAQLLAGRAAKVICVSDREGDVWAHFAHAPREVELAVRSRHDRPLEDGETLFGALCDQPPLAVCQVRVAPRGPGDKGRTAQVELRARTVRIKRPNTAPSTDPPRLELGLVEVVEPDPPQGAKPLLWRILTTLPVGRAEEAQAVIGYYRLRWRIEEVFRALKRDGLALEQTQLQDRERLFRLAAMGLGAAVRILQLVDARDGGSRPMSDVLDQALVQHVAVLVRRREGPTPKQKNPHPEGSLAWLAWVVARYGGWNCYGKPPGPKTMADGWTQFAATLTGLILADQLQNV